MSYYKSFGGQMHVAEDVFLPGLDLIATEHALHTYPVEGWYWFDTEDDAIAMLGTNVETDIQVVARNADNGKALFGVRVDEGGVALINLSTVDVTVDASGGGYAITGLLLTPGQRRYLRYPEVT